MVKKKTINKGETKINMKKIAIIGSGSWGVALATYLANVGNQVKIWSFSEEERDLINNEKKCKFLPDLIIPENIYCSTSYEEVIKDTEFILHVTPSKFTRSTFKQYKQYVGEKPVIICSKGFEKETLKSAPPAPVYDYFEHSILSSIISLYGKTLPRVVLREHYRCHPQIIEFCNQKYYNGDLIPYTSPTLSKMPLVLYKTVEGNHMRKVTRGKEKGKYNQRELDVIVEEVLNNPDLAADSSKIHFVKQYRKQADTAGRQ